MDRVTIIGAGNMARGIGTRLVSGGAQVQVLAPEADAAQALAAELAGRDGSVTGGGASEELTGDIVVLATPYDGALEVAQSRAADLAGKLVVDITNPVDWESFDRLVTPADSSAAEEIAKRAPDARVVKAFNTTFAATLVAGGVAGQPLDVLIAGDDEDAKARLAALVETGGMRAIDAGPLRRARQLEQLGFLHMALQETLGSGYGSAVRFATPEA
jgi:8-hydroxy-5-deazaflavin:NADPH oxidoreductase